MFRDALKRFFTNKKTYAIACACTLLGIYKFSKIGVPSFIENKFSYKVGYCRRRISGKLVNLVFLNSPSSPPKKKFNFFSLNYHFIIFIKF